MDILDFEYYDFKETSLYHRYISNAHIEPLLKKLPEKFHVNTLGSSVEERPIYAVRIGSGKKKVVLWSQMHGNESTTTKALFDLFNHFIEDNSLLNHITFIVIPILNPDGAYAYTRVNANNIDLNRDAQHLSQPESVVLRQIFDQFRPDFCFNLHGQRTIFSAGQTNNSATLSFLSPAQDKSLTITKNRKVAMAIIAAINKEMQKIIPDQVGVYDDTFNHNCVGDTFQSYNIPTILFEAGHYANDYEREEVRRLVFMSFIFAFREIAYNNELGSNYNAYFDIPENMKLFYDLIIRSAKHHIDQKEIIIDIAIQYEEILIDNQVNFIPKVKAIGDLSSYYGHREINANKQQLVIPNGTALDLENSIDCVTINGVEYSLNLIKS